MKYYYYTYTTFDSRGNVCAKYYNRGLVSTGGELFPVAEIMENLCKEYNVKFGNVHITFWAEISEREFKDFTEKIKASKL